MSKHHARWPEPERVGVDPAAATVESVPATSTFRPAPVAGLTVGRVDDPAEHAADALAETALARLCRVTDSYDVEPVQPHRHDVSCGHLRRASTPGPRTAVVGAAGGLLDPETSAHIQTRLGGGTPLPGPVRDRMEVAFDAPLDHVRLHHDAEAGRLSRAMSARAFTVGRDIFLGGGGPSGSLSSHDDRVLAHEIAHALAEPDARRERLRRWWEPMKATVAMKGEVSRPLPQPDPLQPPLGNRQVPGVRWEEVKGDPKNAYRMVDSTGQGWEAPEGRKPFVKSDWNKMKEKAAAFWYDATAATWVQGLPPATHRPALDEERPDLTGDLHGYPSAADVPVLVKAKYRQKPGTKTKSDRGPGLRALDRTARVLMQGMPDTGTPHLATADVGGKLLVAGNTGTRNVTATDATRGTANLSTALDPTGKPEGRRATKDARKLRALQSGDYRAHHAKADDDLAALSGALESPPEWGNIDVRGAGSEHGEMTVLTQLHQELSANPNTAARKITRPLGGVKKACGACNLAFRAYNEHIAGPLGYVVRIAGTHGGFYNGWRVPDVIRTNPAALKAVRDGLPSGAYLDDGVLGGVTDTDATYHDPDESDSEWEEV